MYFACPSKAIPRAFEGLFISAAKVAVDDPSPFGGGFFHVQMFWRKESAVKTVDLSVLDASSPSVLFSTLQPHVEPPKELELLVVFLKGSTVVGLQTLASLISWVDVVEDLPTVSETHGADSVVLILWGVKVDAGLPGAAQVAEVIEFLQSSIKPLVKDVFFSNGIRYWSYMCQG